MLKKLRRNKKGFTLAELLIVVAIIGVLVAVSIPVFTSQLEKSREATDLANLRAAKAAATVAYLSEESPVWTDTNGNKTVNTGDMYYNTATGKIDTAGNACGKGTSQDGHCESTTFGTYTYASTNDVAGAKIKVSVTANGDVTCSFEK